MKMLMRNLPESSDLLLFDAEYEGNVSIFSLFNAEDEKET